MSGVVKSKLQVVVDVSIATDAVVKQNLVFLNAISASMVF